MKTKIEKINEKEIKKMEKAIKEGFVEAERVIKKESNKKYSSFSLNLT